VKLYSRATPWSVSEPIGRLFLDLLRDSSWNLRRVETIRLLDQYQVERRVSIDIDLRNLRRRFKSRGLTGLKIVPLPIFTQVKTLILDLDVRLGDGSAVGLGTSAQDSWIAYSMLLCVAADNALDPSTFSPVLLEEIYACVRHLPEEDELQAISMIDSVDRVSEYWMAKASELFSASEDRDLWEQLFAVPAFAALAGDFTLKSMAVAAIDISAGQTSIIKYRHVDIGFDPELAGSERWGTNALEYFVPANSIGFAQREHTRLLAPVGMELTDIVLWERAPLGAGEALPIWVSPRRFHRRITNERGIVYTRRMTRGNYVLGVSLQPRVESLVAPAIVSVALTTFLLLAFAALQLAHSYYFDKVKTDDGVLGKVDADSLTTTLLLGPTLLSLFLVRPLEHSLASTLLLRMRVVIVITAFFMVASASAVALGVQGIVLGILFAVGFVVSALVLALLIVVFVRARRRSERVRKMARRVMSNNLLVSPLLPI
jgi:hypothetical protein